MSENNTVEKTVEEQKKPAAPPPSLGILLKPYRGYVAGLVVLAVASNALNLVTPKLISRAIDSFARGQFVLQNTVIAFVVVALAIFILTYAQNVIQTIASEKVARDLRNDIATKISRQSFLFVQKETPAKLLTYLTSDIDGIKLFVSQAIVSLVSSLFLVIGASVLLISINWKLALAVLAVIPLIGGTFFYSFGRVKVLFTDAQKVIDWLNKVINESILGSALIRILNSQKYEYDKFIAANKEATSVGMRILAIFAGLIPLITFLANLGMLVIVALGGHFILKGSMTLGDFTAFMSYLTILIFPIMMIGFMSTVMGRAAASYARVAEVLNAPDNIQTGTITTPLEGNVEVKNASLSYGEKMVLKDVSFSVKPGSKVAIIGPTAAGKTQLLFALTGLIIPEKGIVTYDGKEIKEYDRPMFYRHIGLVFQDSVIFNLSLRENIAFSDTVTEEDVQRAIDTAELKDFLDALPEGLNTVVSERGTSLSGGQKQRIMLARALAQNPKILFLDDFTARVDSLTEKKILANVERNYPGMTIVSVTQKIASVEHYDDIIVLMEGEVLAQGKHEQLLEKSPEYVQIFNSQRSTGHYE